MSRQVTVEEGVLTCIAEISARDARIAALEAQLAELEEENERLKRVNSGLHDEVQFMRQAVKKNREATPPAHSQRRSYD